MTQPLDPYTLRQAAARWPRETLNPRAAQSFLRSLAEEAERDAAQPATGQDAVQRVLALADHWDTDEDARYTSARIARQTAARALREAVTGAEMGAAQPATVGQTLAQGLHDAACGCGDTEAGRSTYWLTIARAATKELHP